MNIILIPGRTAKGRHISFTARQVSLVAVVVLFILPVFIGTIAFRIQGLLATDSERAPEYLQEQARLLMTERTALEAARRETQAHLNALASRLGYMQAQLARLNALGSRLVQQARLDRKEFDFADIPVGGPERLTVSEVSSSLEALSQTLSQKSESLGRLESVLLDRQVLTAATPRGWPVDGGWMSSGFGRRSDPFSGRVAFHEGVDIANKLGAPIRALGAGIVVFAGEKDGYGVTVEVNHGGGQVTRYGHARAVLVKEGDKVEKGQAIALVGSSGRSTGPHLHLEVLHNGKPINPQPYLRPGA